MEREPKQRRSAAKRALWATVYSPGVFCVFAFLYFFGIPLAPALATSAIGWLALLAWVAVAGYNEHPNGSVFRAAAWSFVALCGMFGTALAWFLFNLSPEKRATFIPW